MASPCLYLDIDESGVTGCTLPCAPLDDPVRINYNELGDLDDDTSQLSAAMDILYTKDKFSTCKRVVVTIPPDWVWFRYPDLPFNDRNKLKQVLPLELGPWFPDPDLPVLLDFHVLNFPLETGRHLIFTGALAETKIKEIFIPLSSMGLSPAMITPRGLAQALAFSSSTTQHPDFLFIHKSLSEITLILMMNGSPLMIRALKNIKSELESDLAEQIHTTLTSAGLRTGLDQDAFYELPILLSDQKSKTGSDQTQFADKLNQALKNVNPGINGPITVITPDPWQDIITPDHQPPNLLNFCVGPYKTDSFFNRYKGSLMTCLVLLSLVFILGVYDLHRKNLHLETQIAGIQTAAMEIYEASFSHTGPVPDLPPLLLMESKVKQARQARAGDEASALPPGAHIRIMEILHELSHRIPADIDMEITRLALNHDRLVLTGVTGNFNDVDRIKGRVQTSPRFKNVSIKSAEADKTGKQVRFKFMLEI